MKLYIVRHGETDWNKEGRVQGRTDIPLNDFGRMLAEKTKKGLSHIEFEVAFSSPLARAKETASIILGESNTCIIEDENIMEIGFGKFEGIQIGKKGQKPPHELRFFFENPEKYTAPEGGETFVDIKRRTSLFLKGIYEKPECRDCNILVVTHGAALAGILNNIRQESLDKFWGQGVHRNCGVTEILVEENMQPKILSENVVYY